MRQRLDYRSNLGSTELLARHSMRAGGARGGYTRLIISGTPFVVAYRIEKNDVKSSCSSRRQGVAEESDRPGP